MQEVLQAITTVGFPIVACGAMAYYITKLTERHEEETQGLKAELAELRIAISNMATKDDMIVLRETIHELGIALEKLTASISGGGTK